MRKIVSQHRKRVSMLTKDIWNEIIKLLCLNDVLSLRATCTKINRIITNNNLYWYEKSFPFLLKSITLEDQLKRKLVIHQDVWTC